MEKMLSEKERMLLRRNNLLSRNQNLLPGREKMLPGKEKMLLESSSVLPREEKMLPDEPTTPSVRSILSFDGGKNAFAGARHSSRRRKISSRGGEKCSSVAQKWLF
jgi:hypothetical protein